MVKAQGWDPKMVDENLKADAKAIVAAGTTFPHLFILKITLSQGFRL